MLSLLIITNMNNIELFHIYKILKYLKNIFLDIQYFYQKITFVKQSTMSSESSVITKVERTNKGIAYK